MILKENVLEAEGITIRDAFRIIDKLPLKILILVSGNKVCGVISDGDIRRLILRGGNLEDYVINAATQKPITAKNHREAKQILMNHTNLKAIPIINEDGYLIDVCSNDGVLIKEINLPVVINAGGRGTRLDPYTRVLPKPLIPIGETTIIELIMREFEQYGCDDFSIIVNYRGQMIKAFFENDHEYKIHWVDEKEPLGTGGGLSLLKGQIEDTFVFTSCDTLIRTDYACILEQHKKERNTVTVVCAYKDFVIPYGVVETGKNGTIIRMREKPEMSFLTNTGMYFVEPQVLTELNMNERIDFPNIISRLMCRGAKVGVYPVSEIEWMDMGQMPELERMRNQLLGK